MIGDGVCNDIINNPQCNYDGGDCCTGEFTYCEKCICYLEDELTTPATGIEFFNNI